ncbi:MAG: Replication factor C small subunit [Candidatus Altiarchaeales archaeon WOR_SM1_86-2]|nr:MAG: Replication factor C small subunit [Candidatus Altiarchaeales archaeon WOR_SM1_86-2]ODS41694.1 MAG: Replication factor C small subunit [Candidatus Altiarchaeales archaeon WOR_SM1_79]
MELPWTEKYRPHKLDDMIGQDKISQRLSAYVSAKSMPHLLFAGPAGTGKTTAALCIAREFFGGTWEDFLELNASDERGIDVVRTKIKDFARTRPIVGEFKMIFLDEADALTPEAQNALRRTMESYTETCRFILSCNYSSKIIEPLQSRCAVFRFKRLSRDAIRGRMEYILKEEGIEYEDAALDAILYVAEGDVRRAINILQSSAASGEVNEENVYSIASAARPEEVLTILNLSLGGKFLDARNLLDKLMLSYGMSGEDILLQMNREVMNLDVEDRMKVKIIDLIGEANFCLVEGANERIQLEALLARIMGLKG